MRRVSTFLLAVLFVALCPRPALAVMSCLAANTSAAALSSLVTNTKALPTSAPANATLWVMILDRSDQTTTVSSVAGSINAAGWVVSSPYDATTVANFRMWYAYKVGATTGTDTITVTFSGAINSQTVVGWCSDDSGQAQTFDAAATNLSLAATTNYDSNTVAATGAGGILGFLFTGSAQTSNLTVDGANEVLLTTVGAGQRVQAVFEPYASAGSYGVETTMAVSSAGAIMVAGFKNPVVATSRKRLTLLGVGDAK